MTTNPSTTPQPKPQPEQKLFSFDHTKLVVGAHFFEAGYRLIEFIVKSEPVFDKTGEGQTTMAWTAIVAADEGKPDPSPVMFFITSNMEHYGPKIYLPDEIIELHGRKYLSR